MNRDGLSVHPAVPAFSEGEVMKVRRRQFLHLAAGAAASPVFLHPAWAQSYPTRPVRLVAPFPKRYDSQRGYYVLVAPHARTRPDVAAFVTFLREQAVPAESMLNAAARPSRAGAVGRRR